MKKFYLIFLAIVIFFSFLFVKTDFVSAQSDNNAEVYFFYSVSCSHCAEEEVFLDELEKKYSQIEIKKYEFSKNIELVKELYQDYNVSSQEQGLVPVTFTGERYFVGFNEQISEEIEGCIHQCLEGKESDSPLAREIKIPIFGKINIEKISFPLLAIILGFFDGFNVCSLGALVLILGLVIALKSKRKILIFGGIFISITIIAYGILIFLWHQIFTFIVPYIRKMEILIGFLALFGAWYFLKKVLDSRKKGYTCNSIGFSENLANKLKDMFEKKVGILMLIIAICFFAIVVTVIEFPCTAFFPVLFTGILAQANIPLHLSLFYIGLYVLFYTLDELIVFFIAVYTMKIWIVSPKFITVLNLIASVMLFLFGFYYLVWPFLGS